VTAELVYNLLHILAGLAVALWAAREILADPPRPPRRADRAPPPRRRSAGLPLRPLLTRSGGWVGE
jgi:hypothetical protein